MKNGEFGQCFRKIPILVKILETFRIWSKFAKNLDLGQICENLDLGRKFWNSRFWSKFWKNLNLDQILKKSRFCSKFSTISILLEIVGQHDFPRNFRKIMILFEIFDNIKLGRNIEILVEIFDKSRFWCWKFWKITILVEICEKIFSILVEFFENLDFARNCRSTRFSSKFS